MLWTFCPPTIWANSLEFSRNRLKLSADKMYRACELKDQTYKKTRTLHFSDNRLYSGFVADWLRLIVVNEGGFQPKKGQGILQPNLSITMRAEFVRPLDPTIGTSSVDVSDIFYFVCSGRGRGSPRRREGGGGIGFLLKIPGGGSPAQEGPRGREGVCGDLGSCLGGRLNIFFGAEMSTKQASRAKGASDTPPLPL